MADRSRRPVSEHSGKVSEPLLVTGCLLGLVAIAFVIRGLLCLLTLDVPGDGPTRAIMAYEWARAPHLVTWGGWPPGLLYLSGVVSLIAPDPIWSVRAVNLLLGTATIPVFFWLVRRVFTLETAWFAAALLVVFPLHVELSATSLAETSFVFEILLGLWLLTAVRDPSPGQLAVGFTALFWATMTRYEAWWFAPVLVVAVATATRRWLPSFGVAVAVVTFPLLWSIGNFLALGHAFYGFDLTQRGAEIAGTHPIVFPEAIAMLASIIGREAGWPLTLSMLVGVFLVPIANGAVLRRERGAYAAITATFWLAMTWYAMRRGHVVFNRYLLLGIVLLLPYAERPWSRLRDRAPKASVVAMVLLVCSTVMPRLGTWPPSASWLTWSPPSDMQALTTWVRRSPYRDATILITEMGWNASYFTLFWPEAAPRRLIVSSWTDDDELRRFLADRRPSLLVTTQDDGPFRSRIERLAGGPIITPRPLQSFGAIEVHVLQTTEP